MTISCKSRGENSKEGFNVGGNAVLDVRKIPMNTPDNSHMLSVVNKFNWSMVDFYGGHSFVVINNLSVARGREHH